MKVKWCVIILLALAGYVHADILSSLMRSRNLSPVTASQMPTNAMVAWIRMLNNTTTNIQDYSPEAAPWDFYDEAAGTGGAAYWTNDAGGAFVLINTNANQKQYLSNRSSTLLNGVANRTIAAWIKPTAWASAGAVRGILSSYDATTSSGMWLGTNGVLGYRYGGNSAAFGVMTNLNTWVHVCMSFKGSLAWSTNSIYLNGVLATNIGQSVTPNIAVADKWKGGWYDANNAWTLQGLFGGVQLWATNLTAAEVRAAWEFGR